LKVVFLAEKTLKKTSNSFNTNQKRNYNPILHP